MVMSETTAAESVSGKDSWTDTWPSLWPSWPTIAAVIACCRGPSWTNANAARLLRQLSGHHWLPLANTSCGVAGVWPQWMLWLTIAADDRKAAAWP
jgi:hypothetical protein